jgi:hypothetical protein
MVNFIPWLLYAQARNTVLIKKGVGWTTEMVWTLWR